LGLTAGTLVGVYEFPFLLAGTAVTLSGAEGSGSGETTVVEGEQNLAVGLWGRPRGGH